MFGEDSKIKRKSNMKGMCEVVWRRARGGGIEIQKKDRKQRVGLKKIEPVSTWKIK